MSLRALPADTSSDLTSSVIGTLTAVVGSATVEDVVLEPAAPVVPDVPVVPDGAEHAAQGQRPGRHWCNPVRRNENAGAQPDARRPHRGCHHGHEHIGVEELGVVEPRVGEAELFGALDNLPGIRRRGQRNTEIHLVPSLRQSPL